MDNRVPLSVPKGHSECRAAVVQFQGPSDRGWLVGRAERQAVLEVLHERRFADEPPGAVFAKLLD
ncbi:MAG: hypothetical protein ACR2M4_02620 [Actinomycetota bacterium]